MTFGRSGQSSDLIHGRCARERLGVVAIVGNELVYPIPGSRHIHKGLLIL